MSTARWLTPNAPEPHKYFTRRLLIPAASDFLGLVNGALFELCQPHNWQQDGDMTPQEAADFFMELWRQYLVNENEPPSWDTPENVDGEPAQPWYEQLEDWIIQGFLAVTFTPLAALVYQTTVPKIRVAIRTGNLGALFKVLINGIEVWTGDSYAPITDLLEQTFDNPTPGQAATVRIVHNGQGEAVVGDAKLEFVRGEAVSSMVATILRADPEGCGVQWSTDNGGQWNTIDLTTCISEVATEKIYQMIADGQLSGPSGQPGPEPSPAPGTCRTWTVTLQGQGKWHLPVPLNYGDSLIVRAITGGWSDGSAAWYCGDGSRYLGSICDDELKTHVEGDPLNPGAYHMALVMFDGTTWYAAPTEEFVYTSGTTPLDLVFQSNDASLSDNFGSISFEVEVCSFAGWMHTFDFETSDQAWELDATLNWGGVYVASTGWETTTGSGNDAMSIKYTFDDPVTIVRVVIDRYRHVPSQQGSSYGSGGIMFDHATYITLEGPAGRQTVEWQGSGTGTVLTYYDSDYLYPGEAGWCYSVTIYGTGPEPTW